MRPYIVHFMLLGLFFSCQIPSSDEPIVREEAIQLDEQFGQFISQFPSIEFPLEIKNDIAKDNDAIPYEQSMEYLGVRWIDEESGIPNYETRPVGYHQVNDSTYAIVFRALELPIGSGDNIHYQMQLFNHKGVRLNEVEIARFSGWDEGYQELIGALGEDMSYKGRYQSEDSAGEFKESYQLDINLDNGKFISNKGEVKSQGKESMITEKPGNHKIDDSGGFIVRQMKNADVSDVIRKDLSGLFETGYQWKDELGENIFIVTIKEMDSKDLEDGSDRFINVYHYVDEGKKFPRRIWKTMDFVKDCQFDNMLGLIDGALSITDLDEDGIAETTYMYALGCRSDVSPYPIKLIMHEGEQKMAIRGYTKLPKEMMDIPELSSLKDEIDEDSFIGQPSAFKEFATAHFKKYSSDLY